MKTIGIAIALMMLQTPNNSTPGTATANSSRPAVYKVDRHEIVLRPKEGIEYKYQMEKGATMVYSWNSTARVNCAPTKIKTIQMTTVIRMSPECRKKGI